MKQDWKTYHFFVNGLKVYETLALESTKHLVMEFLAMKFTQGDKSKIGVSEFKPGLKESLTGFFSVN